MKQGLLLINLGTPDQPDVAGVRRYLRQFLADPRVIDLPLPLRYILLYFFILPFRPKSTAKAYQEIWTPDGSPLLINSQQLVNKLQQRLDANWQVALGMRYGNPSISAALNALSNCEHITVLPLYPQYSSAATGSTLEEVLSLLAVRNNFPSLQVIRDFYKHPGFIAAQAELIKPFLMTHEYVLFSYHGIPERHIKKSGCEKVCQESCPPVTEINQACYRAQCFETTKELAKALNLPKEKYGLSFQSRLGKTPWIKPYTDMILPELAQQGIKRLAVACPSFVADCLETLEEIGIRAQQQWLKLGGEQLTLIPCVNDSPEFVNAVIDMANLHRLNHQ
jgi:protoporphyrin/coproporphyrin ferrochelatase